MPFAQGDLPQSLVSGELDTFGLEAHGSIGQGDAFGGTVLSQRLPTGPATTAAAFPKTAAATTRSVASALFSLRPRLAGFA